jgi:hypothetical protein
LCMSVQEAVVQMIDAVEAPDRARSTDMQTLATRRAHRPRCSAVLPCPTLTNCILLGVCDAGRGIAKQVLVSSFSEVVNALNSWNLMRAAQLLEQSPHCLRGTFPRLDCHAASSIWRQGCPLQSGWLTPPAWKQGFSGSAVQASLVETKLAFENVLDVRFNLTLVVEAVAICPSGQEVPATFHLSQPYLHMAFHILADVSKAQPIAHEVLAAVEALAVRNDGSIAVDSIVRPPWWEYHSALFVDASPVEQLRTVANSVCLQSDQSTAESDGNWSAQFAFDHVPLANAQRAPFEQTLRAAGLLLRPHVVHLGSSCLARCARGLSMTAIGQAAQTSTKLKVLTGIPERISTCLDFLQHDYAMCSLTKSVADARFQRCIGVDSSSENMDAGSVVWHTELLGHNLTANQTAEAASLLSCDAYIRAKSAHCECHPAISDESATPALQELISSVGPRSDHRASNRPADVHAVAERLWSLGYGRASFSTMPPSDSCDANLPAAGNNSASKGTTFFHAALQEHVARVFFCSTHAALAFEDLCDVQRINGRCGVAGKECPATQVTDRGTCLREHACSSGLIESGSTAHLWLRSANAPRWAALPQSGVGFTFVDGRGAFAFGTSWLAEGLIRAGRLYFDTHIRSHPESDLLLVAAASGREGGAIQGFSTHQTGLQIRMQLPAKVADRSVIDWAAAKQQVLALEAAGFSNVKLKGAGERVICEWAPPICRDTGNIIAGEMSAQVQPPSPSGVAKLPRVLSAALYQSIDREWATLFVYGEHLGPTTDHVEAISVGGHSCTAISMQICSTTQRNVLWRDAQHPDAQL